MYKKQHLPYVDGLRSISIISVILYHLNNGYLSGGFLGVDVFFVISGFVVAMSVSHFTSPKLLGFLGYFYARRIIRIVPALMFALLITSLLSAALIPNSWLSSANQKTGLYAVLGLSNFILLSNEGSYFSPRSEFNPFTHTWSLAVEEQFYCIFPLMFFTWFLTRKEVSIFVFLVACLASFGSAVILSSSDQLQAFYMLWSRLWELGTGVLLFQLIQGTQLQVPQRISLFWSEATAFLGLFCIMIALALGLPRLAPFPISLLAVFGTAVVLCSLYRAKIGWIYSLLSSRPLVFIGKISFSLYLWHWPIFVLFRWTIGLETYLNQILALSLVVMCSMFSFYFIEQPLRRLANGLSKKFIIPAGASLIVFVFLVISAIGANQNALSLSVVSKKNDLWYPEAGNISNDNFPCPVESRSINFDGGNVIKHTRGSCLEPTSNSATIYVLGDSHAMHFIPMLKRAVSSAGVQVSAYTVGGCPFMDFSPSVSGRGDRCRNFGDTAVKHMLQTLRQGDIVFLSSLRLPRMVSQWDVYGIDHARSEMFSDLFVKGREEAMRAALPILKDVQRKGAHIIFPAPTPMLESVPFRCADWFNKDNPICSKGLSIQRAFLEEIRNPILAIFSELKVEIDSIHVWDTIPVLCLDEICNAFREEKPILFDGDHLTYHSNMLLYPSFMSLVEELRAR